MSIPQLLCNVNKLYSCLERHSTVPTYDILHRFWVKPCLAKRNETFVRFSNTKKLNSVGTYIALHMLKMNACKFRERSVTGLTSLRVALYEIWFEMESKYSYKWKNNGNSKRIQSVLCEDTLHVKRRIVVSRSLF